MFTTAGLFCAKKAIFPSKKSPPIVFFSFRMDPKFRKHVNERIIGGDEVEPHSIPFQVIYLHTIHSASLNYLWHASHKILYEFKPLCRYNVARCWSKKYPNFLQKLTKSINISLT